MSFRVKGYYSRLEWEIGRGGFGKVCVGYHQDADGAEIDCFCEDCESKKQVAIKLERAGKAPSYLQHEASVLNRLQGGHGIPRFFLYTRMEIPVLRSASSRSSSPPPTPRSSHNQVNYVKSPLSSPAISETSIAASAQLRGRSYDLQQPLSAVPKEPYNALVMQRLGKDLGSMFRKHLLQMATGDGKVQDPATEHHCSTPNGQGPGTLSRRNSQPRFSANAVLRPGWDIDTVAWIGSNLLRSIEHMHSKGFVHRDIKPENMSIGAGKRRDALFLIDFGMAKSFRNADGFHVIKPSGRAICVGTQAFMSRRCQSSRRDDIESWFYVLLYLFYGRLPWSTHAQKFEETFAKSGQKWTKESLALNTDIQREKEAMFSSGGAKLDLPADLAMALHYISGLTFASKPDYRYLTNILQTWKLAGRNHRKQIEIIQGSTNSPRAAPGWKRKGYFDE